MNVPEGHPVGYIFRRETFNRGPDYKPFLDYQMNHSNNNFYRKNLISHFGCINAIEFNNAGNILASGGDDRRILLWNVSKAITGKEEPKTMQAEHLSNVFALAFDCTNTKIFSAGNDDQVIVHDIATGAPVDYFVQEQPVFGVSSDPLNQSIFASACDDGRILIYDIRESTSDPFCLAKLHSSFHSVMFHPVEPRLIVTANAKEGVALWDVRMPKISLLKYGRQSGDQCCMSARFNRNGTQVLALRRRLPPILYSTHSSAHLFQFNHSSYYNSCTMKSCCFGGSSDQFVMSGSDNFDIHVWKIPPVGSNQWVNQAHTVLKGHRSIANQVRYNYTYNLIASSGVEKMVKLWSPSTLSDKSCWKNDESGLRSEAARKIYSHEEYIRLVLHSGQGQFMSISQESGRKSTKEDSRMMAFFDALVQRDIVGLSEDESDADSTYTNTIYSTHESSSDDDDVASTSGTAELNPQIVNVPSTLTQELSSSHSQNIENDIQLEARMVDMDDLPVIDSDDSDNSVVHHRTSDSEDPVRRLMLVDAELDRAIRVEYSNDGDDNDSNTVSPNRPLSQASSDPNMLTKLIAARESQLRRLAKCKSKVPVGETANKTNKKSLSRAAERKKSLPQNSNLSSSSSDETENINTDRDSNNSPSHSQDHNNEAKNSSPPVRQKSRKSSESHLDSRIRHRERRRSVQSTLVYESSNNTHVTSPDVSQNFQLISDLMTRTQASSSNNTSAASVSSSSSSSSVSSSSSSSDNDNVLDNPKFLYLNSSHIKSRMGYGKGVSVHTTYIVSDSSDDASNSESRPFVGTTKKITELIKPKRQRWRKNRTNKISNPTTNSSSSSSSSESQVEDEPPRKKCKKTGAVDTFRNYRSKSKKVKGDKGKLSSKLGTPSDSGIEMSKANDQEPCCSKSCTPLVFRNDEDETLSLSDNNDS